MPRTTMIPLLILVGLLGCDAVVDDPELRAFQLPGDDCRVGMWDAFNEFSTILTVRPGDDGELSFIVDDNFGLGEVRATFASRDAPMVSDVCVPDRTLNEICEDHRVDTKIFNERGVVLVGSQLTYYMLPNAGCSEDEFALILFFVNEWFYFG